MPCDSITTVALNVGKMNPETLKRALEALGYEQVRIEGKMVKFRKGWNNYTYRDGEIIGPKGLDLGEVKRGYSKQVVRDNAKRFGWLVKEQGDKLVVQRRF